MNAYFFNTTPEERKNILDQHKHLYDGYVTKYNQESNQTPLYVQDLANDKMGITINSKGDVKNYTNFKINESPLDRISDGPLDLKNGTVDIDSVEDTNEDNIEFMHDVLPSPSESDGFEEEMEDNYDQYEYDIDELEDYSSEEIDEEVYEDLDEDIVESFKYQIKESLDMFRRFKKYN